MIVKFITILAWCFLGLATIRFFAVCFFSSDSIEIKIAEAMGQNPVGSALAKCIIVGLVCSAWFLAKHYS